LASIHIPRLSSDAAGNRISWRLPYSCPLRTDPHAARLRADFHTLRWCSAHSCPWLLPRRCSTTRSTTCSTTLGPADDPLSATQWDSRGQRGVPSVAAADV